MRRTRPRSAKAPSFVVEGLESRVVLSGAHAAGVLPMVAAQGVHKAATHTSLAIAAGTLGQPITFRVTVSASAAAGAPTGTVNLIDHGKVVGALTLSPSTNGGASSVATATFTPRAGGASYYFGKHAITAAFVPGAGFAKSTATRSFAVSQPAYTTLADGTQVATVAQGSGPQIQSGQTAKVLYTGYLQKNGHIFDDSANDGGTPLGFAVGAGQVIPGFDAGVAGMQVGETRIILIPPADGYGPTATGPIPANSTLVFVVTLESIS